MYEILLIVFLLVSLSLVGIILIQQGKGADMGSAFGSGASGTVFGASGAGNFLTRTTAILATSFLVLSLVLGYLSSNKVNETDEFLAGVPEQKAEAVVEPVTPEEVAAESVVPTTEDVVPAE